MKKIKNTFNKLVSMITVLSLLMMQTLPVYAEDPAPTPTEAPVVEAQQTTQTPADTQSVTPVTEPTPSPTVETTTTSGANLNTATTTPDRDAIIAAAEEAERKRLYEQYGLTPPSGTTGGDSTITTGDAGTTVGSTTQANTNIATNDANGTGTAGGASVVNSGNGSDSTNNGSISIVDDNETDQDNSATVGNNTEGATVTGTNSSSYVVGDSTIDTGDANTSGTAVTAVNTNVSGVRVAEFNIVDDHVGDVILDFSANCISGCGTTGQVANTGNGSDSTNTADLNQTTTNTTNQDNTAGVGNNMTLSSDSGDNSGSFNTSGDTTINTGDANVAANSLTFANNNLAGNVTFGVINIYGNLEGDIILPDSQVAPANTVGAYNTGNGSNSTNTSTLDSNTIDNTFQNNDVSINNNLILDANTGENDARFNTGGNSTITTGASSVDANVINIANSNVDSGQTWWLVFINQAGNWFGQILGAPDGQNYAGSAGTTFSIGTEGELSALFGNANNGSGSENNTNATINTTNNTTQNNTATINNTLNLSANTGRNDANFNTGGNSTINTGNANIIANLVNFVNNNVKGGGNLVVTVVNVFGSWVGDFVTPGQKKENKTTQQQSASVTTSANNNSSNTSSSTGNSVQSTNNTQQSKSNDEDRAGLVGLISQRFFSPTTDSIAVAEDTQQTAGVSNGVPHHGNLLAAAKQLVSDTAKSPNESITINLAWLVVLLPLILAGFAVRQLIIKRLMSQRS